MRTFVLLLATVVTLLVASTASAAIPISYIEYPTDNTDPMVRSCVAYSAYGQRCKMCDPNYTDGAITSWNCVPVTNSENFCTCGDMSKGRCLPKGLCKYI